MDVSYDNRDGYIWLDGELVPWRNAQIHILTHAYTMRARYLKESEPIIVKYLKAKIIQNGY